MEISQRTLETQQDQQVTERFTRAIEQLGATDDNGKKKLEIRLGGIYALERIARDSPERDYSTVMEVLTAYVRENSPRSPKVSSVAAKQEEGGEQGEASEPEEFSSPQIPPADIKAIVDVLRRREEDRVPERFRVRLDLQRTNLGEANLYRANLERAILGGANLNEANLRGANLRGANLYEANLRGANLGGATNLAQNQIEVAFGDATTNLPWGLHRPASWKEDEERLTDEDE